MSGAEAAALRGAVEDIRGARLAVTNGEVDEARGCLDVAVSEIDALLAVAEIPDWPIDDVEIEEEAEPDLRHARRGVL